VINSSNIYNNGGNIGIGTTTPLYKLHVEFDSDNNPVIFGRNTNTSTGTTSFGVRGEVNSTGAGSAGVFGYSNNASQNEIGVLGDYVLWGAAVFGRGWLGTTTPPNTLDYGVFGTVNFPTGYGGYFENLSTGGGYGIMGRSFGFGWAVYSDGDFTASGVKAATVPTSKGNQLLYCVESPELWFEDMGVGTLVNGQVTIQLDKLFLETVTVDSENPLIVFVEEYGESNGLFVEPGTTSFTVKEKQAGTSNIKFSYKVMAKRRWYEDLRFGYDPTNGPEDRTGTIKKVEPRPIEPAEFDKKVAPVINKANAAKAAANVPHK
jgi:hypothetical protein